RLAASPCPASTTLWWAGRSGPRRASPPTDRASAPRPSVAAAPARANRQVFLPTYDPRVTALPSRPGYVPRPRPATAPGPPPPASPPPPGRAPERPRPPRTPPPPPR